MDRRQFLTALSTVTALGVAGCSQAGGGDSPEASPTATHTPQGDTTPTSTPTAIETETSTPTDGGMETATASAKPTDSPTATGTPLPDVAAEVSVAAGGQFAFEPETVTISRGETVRWTWAAGGHNVKPDDIPSESDWTGTPGGRSDTFPEGYVYTHTFEVAGEYDYICVPHFSAYGMAGTVVVE